MSNVLSETENKVNKRERKKNTKPDFFRMFIPNYLYRKYTICLDCASGDGYMVADSLIKRARGDKGIKPENYICIDMDESKLQRLKEMGCKTICIDLEKSDIKEYVERAHLILCIETLEHLEKNTAIRLVEDFVSVLVKGGMMIITFPIYVELGNQKENKCPNKHIPDVNILSEFGKHFSDFSIEMMPKSYVMIFRGKK